MKPVHTHCPIVRAETVKFADRGKIAKSSASFERTVLWMRRAEAQVSFKGAGDVNRVGSFSRDVRGLFEGVENAIRSASETVRNHESMLSRAYLGDYEVEVSAAVVDVPMLADDRSARNWTAMDDLYPASYVPIPKNWVVEAPRKRNRRSGIAQAVPLVPEVVRPMSPVWSSLATEERNERSISELTLLAPADEERETTSAGYEETRLPVAA